MQGLYLAIVGARIAGGSEPARREARSADDRHRVGARFDPKHGYTDRGARHADSRTRRSYVFRRIGVRRGVRRERQRRDIGTKAERKERDRGYVDDRRKSQRKSAKEQANKHGIPQSERVTNGY